MTFFRKTQLYLTILLTLLTIPNTIASQERDPLLSDEDILLQQTDSSVSALSSSLVDEIQWESPNQWMCFDTESIEITLAEVKSGSRNSHLPIINASLLGHRFEVSTEIESDEKNENTLSSWLSLLRGSRRTCIYAAYLQNTESPDDLTSSASIWIISKLKTENGYWNYEDSE